MRLIVSAPDNDRIATEAPPTLQLICTNCNLPLCVIGPRHFQCSGKCTRPNCCAYPGCTCVFGKPAGIGLYQRQAHTDWYITEVSQAWQPKGVEEIARAWLDVESHLQHTLPPNSRRSVINTAIIQQLVKRYTTRSAEGIKQLFNKGLGGKTAARRPQEGYCPCPIISGFWPSEGCNQETTGSQRTPSR